MRRAPLVITGTVVGLAGVLAFRSTPAPLSLGGVGAATTTTTSSSNTTTTSPPGPTTTTRTSTPSTSTPASTPTTAHVSVTTRPTTTLAPTTTVAATVRSATGPVVNYNFGTLSVKVTASGSKITAVTIASLNDGGNPRSQYIDQQSLPILIQEVMSAQGSNIQSVSGASYTSEGFYTSLLGALKQLGI